MNLYLDTTSREVQHTTLTKKVRWNRHFKASSFCTSFSCVERRKFATVDHIVRGKYTVYKIAQNVTAPRHDPVAGPKKRVICDLLATRGSFRIKRKLWLWLMWPYTFSNMNFSCADECDVSAIAPLPAVIKVSTLPCSGECAIAVCEQNFASFFERTSTSQLFCSPLKKNLIFFW